MTTEEVVIEKLYQRPLHKLKAPKGFKFTDVFAVPPQDLTQFFLSAIDRKALKGSVSSNIAERRRLFLEKL